MSHICAEVAIAATLFTALSAAGRLYRLAFVPASPCGVVGGAKGPPRYACQGVRNIVRTKKTGPRGGAPTPFCMSARGVAINAPDGKPFEGKLRQGAFDGTDTLRGPEPARRLVCTRDPASFLKVSGILSGDGTGKKSSAKKKNPPRENGWILHEGQEFKKKVEAPLCLVETEVSEAHEEK